MDVEGAPVPLEFGRFKVLRHRRELLVDGRAVELGGRAFDTLIALIDARGAVLDKDTLLQRVWPDSVVDENNLQAQISTLRKILGADRALIRTVAGRGYQFAGDLRDASMARTPARRTNLPSHLPELIGRENSLSRVVDLVAAHRLVTLTGSGGVGKTRLALEAARQMLPCFPDGVWLVELGPLADPALVPVAAAAALDLPPGSGPVTADRVATALRAKHILLVLDNCEHVIDAAAAMAVALVVGGAHVRVLITSREPLRTTEEHVYRVPSLQVPAEDNLDPDDVSRYEAVRLFDARARAAEPEYVADRRRRAAVAAICRRLDGIPLAIELAAARVAAFGVEGVAARLDDRFRLLTGGIRTALPRQQTLHATLDWSHELLAESERVVLRRLAVFAGAFTLEAATAVAASALFPAPAVVDCLANLVSKSLVSADLTGATTQYRLLETTRAYANEKLIQSAELEQFARRHAEYHRNLFEHAEAESETRAAAEWLAAYRPHLDNLRAALDWAFSPGGDAAVGVALTVATVPLWVHLALIAECRLRVEQALAHLESVVPADAGRDMRLFLALGITALHTRDIGSPKMAVALTKALELAESLEDTDYQLRALFGLCMYRRTVGDYRGALTFAERLGAVASKTGDPTDLHIGERFVGGGLHILGDQRGARQRFGPLLNADVATARQSHIIRYQWDQRVVTHCFYARILWTQGFTEQAMSIAEEVVDYAHGRGHVLSLLYTLGHAACPIAVYSGDLVTADRYAKLVADLAATHGLDAWSMWAQSLEAVILLKRGESAAGAQLLRTALGGLPEGAFYLNRNLFLAELAEGFGVAGQTAEGLTLIESVLARAERTEEGWCLAELLRKKGELLSVAPTAVADAEKCFQRALEVARRQDALFWELRAATSLARLWHGRRRTSQARRLLSAVYRRFTEGFGTADLVAAKALLDNLPS